MAVLAIQTSKQAIKFSPLIKRMPIAPRPISSSITPVVNTQSLGGVAAQSTQPSSATSGQLGYKTPPSSISLGNAGVSAFSGNWKWYAVAALAVIGILAVFSKW